MAQTARMKGEVSNQGYRFSINDWVKRRNFSKTKFQNSWTGPYVVVELGFPGTYWLMGPDGIRLPSLVNESHLKPWLSQSQEELSDNEEISINEEVNDFPANSNESLAAEEEDNDIPPAF